MFVSNSRAAVARIARVVAKNCNRTASPFRLAVPSTTSRGFVSATDAVLEKHITKVPTMGDSITEGTIVEWMAQVGQRVEEEDVIALIETDKVTVDIKATKAGVMTQQFGAIDDEVEVGADLYEIDTEAEATIEAAEVAAEPAEVAAEPAQTTTAPVSAAPAPAPTPVVSAVSSDTSSSSSSGRVPSIKFLGKEGWASALTVEPKLVIPATYGRLEFSEEEIEALLSGGANLAPELKEFSTGAIFSA